MVKNRASPVTVKKIMKVTVLPIQWFALMKSHVFINVIKNIYIKGKRMAPTNLSKGLYMKDLWSQPWGLSLAKDRMELFIEVVDWNSTISCS
jgi:hypothetical protein